MRTFSGRGLLILLTIVLGSLAQEEIVENLIIEPDAQDLTSLITSIRRELVLVDTIQEKREEPIENIYKHYDIAVNYIDKLTELVKSEEEAEKFNTQHGVDRIIIPYLNTDHNELKVKLLNLLDGIVSTYPTIINDLPHNICDKIVKSFLNSFDSDEKQAALDILGKILPGNPAAQTRLMKVAGLTPFYKHMKTEQPQVVKQLIELFNLVVKEHIEVRKLEEQGATGDDFITYRRIGLIERLGTPEVCNGLFDVIGNVWLPNSASKNPSITAPIFNIMATIKDYCLPIYRRSGLPIKLFQNMLDTMKSSYSEEKLRLLYKDYDEIVVLLTEYADTSKVQKMTRIDEL